MAVIGVKITFSAVLCDIKFNMVFSPIYAVMNQEIIFIVMVDFLDPQTPARLRMTKINAPNMMAEMILAILKPGVKTVCFPPQTMVTGKIPAASSN